MIPIIILSSYDLTYSEEHIAKEINKNPNYFIKNSITTISQELGVATSTISRLAKKLGYKTFKEFKLFIYEKNKQIKNNFSIENGGKLPKLIQKIKNFNMYSIFETINNLDPAELNSVIHCILKSKRIFIYGVGSGGMVASEMNNNLRRLGLNSHTSQDFHGQILFLNSFKENELFILFSTSGLTREIIELIKIAQHNNCQTLLITARQDLGKTLQPNFVLYYYVHYDESAYFPIISSKISQLIISDILVSMLIEKLPDKQEEIENGKHLIVNWNRTGSIF
ncbi:MurR/RpiR family transcriptional regulator [Spiroplasma sp. DGKH1]|uniref:MurR/RpiR family transcriptional regulator n=1 Tax=Spiroplasma sp. DGKH1 TaxID=3050074 RepID=UPI0034C68453